MNLLKFKIFEGHRVEAAFFPRGNDARFDWKMMSEELGFEKVAQLRQVHGNRVIRISGETLPPYDEADALVTAVRGVLLAVRVADCASVFLYDPVVKAVSLVHAGWRGLVSGVIPVALGTLKDDFGSAPGNLLAAAGPSLGPCCARFSVPEEELPEKLHQYILEEKMVDLWAIVADQLRSSGVHENHTELIHRCTACHPDQFYSHRKGDAERMGAFIGLKGGTREAFKE